MSLFTKIFGTSSQRELKSIYPIADKVDALEEEYKALTDAQLQAKTHGGWTTSSPRPLPPAGRPPGVSSACGPTGCRWWAASSSTRAASPR